MTSPPEARAAYVHIPFCLSKCHYCDFNSYPGREDIFDEYVDALVIEISRVVGDTNNRLGSVYFGGGTPTLLPAEITAKLLETLQQVIGVDEDAETTIEANPGTVDIYKFEQLRAAKFNRVSLGVQSFDTGFLQKIGRVHDVMDAVRAYDAARNAGFMNISIDLIFALPGQTLDHWRNTLEYALKLNPEHISLYELTIEEGTKFAQLCAKGVVEIITEETQIEMYETAIDMLRDAGYIHYEVSNFAKPGYECIHNKVYWNNDSYYGFGAGATSYLSGTRAIRAANPEDFIREIDAGRDAVESSEQLKGKALAAETITQGMRMLSGVDVSGLSAKTGIDILAEFSKEIGSLADRNLIELKNGILRVTHKGLLLLNDVAAEFVVI